MIKINVSTDIISNFDVENSDCNVDASFFIDENASGYDAIYTFIKAMELSGFYPSTIIKCMKEVIEDYSDD